MLLRGLILILTLAVVLAEPTFAANGLRFRVSSRDAYATQCRAGICATVQVTHTRYSTGMEETILFFSAYDAAGQPLTSPFPFPSNHIPHEAFTMNREGTKATLNYGGAEVTWDETGDYSRITENVERVRDTRPDGRSLGSYRLTELAQTLGADAEGTVGGITFAVEAANAVAGDFGNAFLTVRRTVRVEKN